MPVYSDSTRLNRFLIGAIASAFAFLTGLYIYYWELCYDSDYGLIGLIAKRILEHGEHPIFVWKVGYQGMLLEGHAVALVFKLFGIGPHTLTLAPCFFFLLLVFFFFRATRQYFGQTTALLATLFVVVSNPAFYDRVTRTQPNYAETFLFGMILFITYTKLVERLYVLKMNPGRQDLILGSVLGFTMGFGLYTYGQIFYFIAAIALHGFLIFLRSLADRGFFRILWNLCNPQLRLKDKTTRVLLTGVSLFNLTHFSFALISFIVGVQTFSRGSFKIRWDSLAMIQVSVELAVLLNLSILGFLYRKKARHYFQLLGIVGGSALLGFLPTLVYRFVQRGQVYSHMGIGGSPSEVAERFGWAMIGQARFFNLLPLNPLSLLSGLIVAVCVAVFVKNEFIQARLFVRGKAPRGAILQIPPFVFLLPVILIAFSFSTAGVHWTTYRYTVALTLFYGVAIAYSAVTFSEFVKTRDWKVGIAILLGAVLLNNSLGFYKAVHELELPYPQLAIVDWMKNRGIHHAYADFYYGYSMVFLTNEEIIIEPLYSNYSPYYAAPVAEADHLAYIDVKPYKAFVADQEIVIHGTHYRILEKQNFGKADAFRLQKIHAVL